MRLNELLLNAQDKKYNPNGDKGMSVCYMNADFARSKMMQEIRLIKSSPENAYLWANCFASFSYSTQYLFLTITL